MADYDLYYWNLPFRGQFIRAILAYAGKSWTEHDEAEIQYLMALDAPKQPVPFMGPPVLVDRGSGLALSQMPAIAIFLGDMFNLTGSDPAMRARIAKVANDANDVIDELTLDGGRNMWTKASWDAFVPRLQKWMMIWEAVWGKGASPTGQSFLLGTPEPSLADILTGTLWGTMGDRFPVLRAMLVEAAPRTAELVQRIEATPALLKLRNESLDRYGNAYCGGEIEKSLRAVLVADSWVARK